MPAGSAAVKERHQPLVLVDTAGLSEEEWLAYRRKGIGGSDVAALLGISPWRTARDLFYDKLNIAVVEDHEWEAKQAEKKKALQEQMDRLAAMSDDEVVSASMQRVSGDVEKLTRRNMKECVSEYIQTKCLEDPAFARLTMHPKKTMVHCFQYISRKAWEYIQDELKANGIQPGQGSQGYGCDIPDDLCYQWSEDYFRDADAKEDQEEEEKFVPRPYYGKSSVKSSKKKKAEKKPAEKKKPESKPAPEKKPAADGQMSLMDFGMAKAG